MTQASEMSMSVSCSGCGVQYAGKRGLAGLGAGLRRGGPRYLRMLAEVPRFHRAARRVLASGESGELSLADFLRARGFSAYFTTHFAAPLVGAVWSCPPGVALRYPAGYLFAFLANHGMLSVSGSPPWRTVSGRLAVLRRADSDPAGKGTPGGARALGRIAIRTGLSCATPPARCSASTPW